MSAHELEAVIGRYFDALYYADADLMKGVLHPAAVYATADEEAPLIRSTDVYLDVLREREAPVARGETRRDEILSLESAGENTAIARARCSIGNRDFTDFLSLIRVDGEWRIIAKVFAISFRSQED